MLMEWARQTTLKLSISWVLGQNQQKKQFLLKNENVMLI